MKIADLTPGMTLYDVHSQRAGNTTMRVEGCWKARVISVHLDESPPYAMISWNANPPRKYFTVKWKRCPKEWLRQDIFGPRSCCICHAKEHEGHRETCQHPRAISARKKAAKS